MKSSITLETDFIVGSWCSVLKRVFAAVNALAQIASFADGLECRPIRPCANCEAVFASA